MKKIKITTPENIEVEYTLADLGSRTAAAVIDTLIQSIIFLIMAVAVFLIAYFSPEFWELYYGWIIGISLLIYFLISYGYYIAIELSTNGMTFGKKVLKLRAIRNNGQPLTLKHSAIRNLFKVLIDMLGIGPVLIFFSKQHKRLGDFAASTIVIIEESKTKPFTLESLQNINDKLNYYLSREEQEILRDYLARRDGTESYSHLSEELRHYFKRKFEGLGILSEWEEFIDSL